MPVDPALDERGRLRALVPYLNDGAMPVPLGQVESSWDTLIEASMASAEVFAKIGVGTFFGAEASFMHQGLVFDALVGKNRLRSGDVAQHDIVRTFWGVGVRIVVRYQFFEAQSSVNVGMLAAAVETNAASAQYEVRSLGLGPTHMAMVLEAVPALGRLDMETFGSLMSAVDTLKADLLANAQPSSLRPAFVGFKRKLPIDDMITDATAFRYVMVAIANGESLARALEKRWPSIHETRVRELYAEFAPQGVTSEARAKAREWLSLEGA